MIPLLLALLAAPAVAAPPSMNIPDAHVVMPWNRFEDLYKKGLAPEKPPVTAPRDFTLDAATYSGTVVGEGDDAYALLSVTVRGQVLARDKWAAIPLLGASTALAQAKVNGKDAAIYVDRGYYTLLTQTPGPFVAELQFAVALTRADADTFFTFEPAPSGATSLAFTVDSADPVDFTVSQARGVTETSAGRAHSVKAVLPATQSVTVSWQRRIQDEVVAATPRVYAEVQTLVGVGEGVLQGRANVGYTVLHKGVDRFRVRVPKDVTILDVAGPGIREWTQDKDGVITVALTYAALGGYRLTVDYERPLGDGALPLVEVLDVAREKAWIGVDARSAQELVAGAATNATPVDVRELPAALVGQTDYPVLLAWKARGGAVSIPLQVKSHPDVDMLVTLIDTALADTLVTVDGRRMTQVRYAVRNNRNQFLRLALPEGAEVWSASVAGRGVKIARGEGGVLVPLVRSDASGGSLSAFLVELVYVENGSALGTSGTARAELPRTDAPTSQLQWTVHFPADAKIGKRSHEGSVRHVEWYSGAPQLPQDAVVTEQMTRNVQAAAAGQDLAGTLGQGVEPVEVSLPLSGQTVLFEKMLVLDEPLWVSFDYTRKEP